MLIVWMMAPSLPVTDYLIYFGKGDSWDESEPDYFCIILT